MLKLLLSVFIVLSSMACCYAQDNLIEKKLDDLFSKSFKTHTPGCAVLIAKRGQVIYNKAFGSAHLGLNIPMAPAMVFNLASITKQFTAVAILQLIEQGKISLRDSVQKFIPDYPSKGYTITIENLLTHTSGIPDYMQIDYKTPFLERWDFSPKQLIDSFKNHSLQFEPGTKYAYSNSGYFLLGYIIEKVSGKNYRNYLQEQIFTPLGLNNTYVDNPASIIPNRVNGYREDGPGFKNADYWSPTIAYSAGGILSNTEDLFKWFNGLLANKIISKQSLEKAFTGFKLKDGSTNSYGYGWMIYNLGNIKSIEHGGKMSGFTTNQMYFPGQDVFIAIFFNYENALKDDLSKQITEIVLGQAIQNQAFKPGEDILNSYLGTYALTTNPGRTIVIAKQANSLIAKVSGQQSFEILFQSTTKFQLQNVKDMLGEFVSENGKVSKIMVSQNGQFEWKKIQ